VWGMTSLKYYINFLDEGVTGPSHTRDVQVLGNLSQLTWLFS